MTNTQRRFWTLFLTITFPIWIIPAVAIFWIVSFVVLLYAAAGDCLEMIEDFIARRKKP